ncbi:MAG: prolyl oligopeptidase family serine peptidase [Rhodospirillales bacterium]
MPRFVPVVRGWVDAGGVLAVAHSRGGGDLGEDWHQAGRKATKQNTIHDFIDSANAMVKLGYAANGTIAGMGTSAGGITIGGAITQSAALFRAALIRVGITDALRFENTEGGPANIAEFGTVKDKTDFWSLLAMDAYQHVKPGLTYPAVLLTAGAQDHRVPLWQSAKMAARLQAVGKLKGPVLLRVDYEGGHGTIGAGQKQANAEWRTASRFCYGSWELRIISLRRKGRPGALPPGPPTACRRCRSRCAAGVFCTISQNCDSGLLARRQCRCGTDEMGSGAYWPQRVQGRALAFTFRKKPSAHGSSASRCSTAIRLSISSCASASVL